MRNTGNVCISRDELKKLPSGEFEGAIQFKKNKKRDYTVHGHHVAIVGKAQAPAVKLHQPYSLAWLLFLPPVIGILAAAVHYRLKLGSKPGKRKNEKGSVYDPSKKPSKRH